jgi:hypothetical protein
MGTSLDRPKAAALLGLEIDMVSADGLEPSTHALKEDSSEVIT